MTARSESRLSSLQMELNLFAVRPSHLSLGEARHGSEKRAGRTRNEDHEVSFAGAERAGRGDHAAHQCADRRTGAEATRDRRVRRLGVRLDPRDRAAWNPPIYWLPN